MTIGICANCGQNQEGAYVRTVLKRTGQASAAANRWGDSPPQERELILGSKEIFICDRCASSSRRSFVVLGLAAVFCVIMTGLTVLVALHPELKGITQNQRYLLVAISVSFVLLLLGSMAIVLLKQRQNQGTLDERRELLAQALAAKERGA